MDGTIGAASVDPFALGFAGNHRDRHPGDDGNYLRSLNSSPEPVLEDRMHYISILSTIMTFIFAAAVFNRYRYKKGNHLLMWGIGLIFYGLGTLTEVLLSFSFSGWALKIWYLSGAMLTAAWLGQGTIFLLIRKRGVAQTLAIILGLVSIGAFILIMVAPITAAAADFVTSQPVSAQYQQILERSGLITLLTILLNIYGTIALVGGAIYSAFLFWRKKVLINRVLGNILIAAGALMPAMAGSFIKAGLVDWLYVSEFLGVLLMYAGFLQATATKPVEQKKPLATTAN
jgi:hypothetical protein